MLVGWVHNKMKVLITTDLFTTETNGVVTSVKNLVEELRKKGHDVKILTLSQKTKSYRTKNVYYIRSVPVKVYPDVRMPMTYRHKFIREIIDWKPDVIHSQCEFFSLQFALKISKETVAPIVHTYHTLYEQYVHYLVPGKRLGRFVVRFLTRKRLKGSSAVIAPTAKVKKALKSYGIEKPIYIVPSGIDLERHKVVLAREERDAMRTELGITKDEKVFINLGRLGDEKNLEELVEYFADVTKNYDKVKFLIVGDGPARKRLEHMTKDLEIEDLVIFTGMVKPEDVQKYYKLGDIFISASTSETQGLTYVEAAANGLPLLCRSDLCLKDVVISGKNGYEYTCKKDFLEKAGILIQDDKLRERVGENSKRIANRFDKQTFGIEIEKVYNEVLKEVNNEEK